MFCPNCGKEIDDNVKFCQFCGKDIKDQEAIKNIETNKEARDSKKFLSGCLSIIGTIIIVFFVFSFIVSDFNTPNNGNNANLELIESHFSRLDYGAHAICGTIENKSDKTVGYAQVEINLYNKKEELIGSTLANINNLEPHTKWKFKAVIIEDNVSTYKIKNITGL